MEKSKLDLFVMANVFSSYQRVAHTQVVGQRVLMVIHEIGEGKPWKVIDGLLTEPWAKTVSYRYDSRAGAEAQLESLVAKYTLPQAIIEIRRAVLKATKAAELARDKAFRTYRAKGMPQSMLNRDFDYLRA